MKLILIIVLLNNSFAQGISYNQEFQVNTYYINNQSNSTAAALDNGGFIISWNSDLQDGNGLGIFAQIYDENGFRNGEEFQVNTFTENDQHSPSIAGLKNGGFFICWVSNEQDGDLSGIYGRLFNESGIAVGDEFKLNDYTVSNQSSPFACSLTRNKFVVAWSSYLQDGSSWGIFAKIFDNFANILTPEFQVNSYFNSSQTNPVIAELTDSNFVVCWQSYLQPPNHWDINAQFFDINGNHVGEEFSANSEIYYNQIDPSIAALKDSGFVVSWTHQYGEFEDIYFQRFNNAGSKQGEETQVYGYRDFFGYSSSVAGLANGGFIICWDTYFWDDLEELYSQLFDNIGNKVGRFFKLNSTTFDRQSAPQVITLLNGNIVTSWSSNQQDGNGDGIFGKYYLSQPIPHNLTPFELIYPESGDTISVRDSLFMWRTPSIKRINFPWELTYEIYIDDNINFSTPQTYNFIQDTIYQMNGLLNYNLYFWKVLARNLSGDSMWSSDIYNFYIDPNYVTYFEENETKFPSNFQLFQNYPNPFNPATKIKFIIPRKENGINVETHGHASLQLKVFDLLGNEITTLVNEHKQPGKYEVEFDASKLSSGVYFYQFKATINGGQAGEFIQTKKMLLIK